MSDLLLSSQQQLTQALAQLSKTAASSPLSQQGAQVIVKHLGGNQLALSDPKVSKTIELSKQGLQGKLISGSPYSVKTSVSPDATSLLFLNIPSSAKAKDLGTLPASLLPVLLESPKSKISTITNEQTQQLSAKIKNISGNNVLVELPTLGKTLSIKVSDPNAIANLRVGQFVQVQLTPIGKSWQARIIQPQSNLGGTLDGLALSKSGSTVAQLLAESLLQNKPSNGPKISLPADALSSLLKSTPAAANKTLMTNLLNHTVKEVTLKIEQNGKIALSAQPAEIAAVLPLQKDKTASLSQFINQLAQVSNAARQTAEATPSSQHKQLELGENPLLSKVTTHSDHSLHRPVRVPIEAQSAGKPIINEIVDLLRKSQPMTTSPSESLSKIEQIILNNTQQVAPATKQVLDSLLAQLKQHIPQGSESDANNIKQVLASPPLSLTPVSLTSTSGSQGLLAGLMTFLQISLGARLSREQPALQARLTQAVSQIISLSNGTASKATSRTMQDLSQLEQRGQLTRELNRIFASHQSSKLANIEQALQGQDSFYYVLPSTLGNARKDIELLIRRTREEHEESKKQVAQAKSWNLTMKLSVGELGEMLGKAKLNNNQLDLDIYTSNDSLKNTVLNFLPLLKQRFTDLGIDVQKAQCQLGKIPETLNNRPYHIFETKA